MNKIAIIGNGGGGKTTLSRKLQEVYKLPLTHVDTIQFVKGMKVRNAEETESMLNELIQKEKWIIDGFGSMDVMKKRFLAADKVVFVDFPLWRHYWWCTKRQIKSYKTPRIELPDGCNEFSLSHTIRLYKILWRVHKDIRPELIRFFKEDEVREKIHLIKNLADWRNTFNKGL